MKFKLIICNPLLWLKKIVLWCESLIYVLVFIPSSVIQVWSMCIPGILQFTHVHDQRPLLHGVYRWFINCMLIYPLFSFCVCYSRCHKILCCTGILVSISLMKPNKKYFILICFSYLTVSHLHVFSTRLSNPRDLFFFSDTRKGNNELQYNSMTMS